MKLHIVVVAGSGEYGAGISTVEAFTTMKEAQKCLSAEYRSAKADMSDCEVLDYSKTNKNFSVADYEDHADSIVGVIRTVEI